MRGRDKSVTGVFISPPSTHPPTVVMGGAHSPNGINSHQSTRVSACDSSDCQRDKMRSCTVCICAPAQL